MAWMLNKYCCPMCDCSWDDEWSCACNDHCPQCGAEIEPEETIDETFSFSPVNRNDPEGETELEVSPESAEDKPAYVSHGFFATRRSAQERARALGWTG